MSRLVFSRIALAWLLAAALVPVVPASAQAAYLPPSEWVVGPHNPVAFITFDGQTKVKYLVKTLDVLRKKRAKASFFIAGSWVSLHPKKARQLARAGHALGNRGWGKSAFTAMDEASIRASIARAQKKISRAGGMGAPFLRVPNGARDLRVLQIAGSMGYRSVRWTHRPGGGVFRRVQRSAVHKAKYGSIISLDVWRKSHRRALPGIIDGLRRRGFELATVKRLGNVHPIRWDVTMRSGSGGPEVAYLQKMLKQTSYPAGPTDGSFGYATLQAVYAYEKVHKIARDGVVPPSQMTSIAMDRRPRKPNRKYHNFIDIDISRQVLFEVRNDKVIHTIPVSSGNEEIYISDGEERRAHTPRGDFTVTRKIKGKRVSDLGTLYWPSYFVGGYAIHGSDSVPTHPASHGCVRIPRYLERAFWYRNPVGRPVFVHN
jgi:peptidoglycan/xylan/chitin deacetylase (PgdA/CDA1 family)/lipoprotein-anchoring transpeptidase ErfK/SrfK